MSWCSAKPLPSLCPSLTCYFSRNLLSWKNGIGQRSELRIREGLGRNGNVRPLEPEQERTEEREMGCNKGSSELRERSHIRLKLECVGVSCFHLCSPHARHNHTIIGELRDEERGTEQHVGKTQVVAAARR